VTGRQVPLAGQAAAPAVPAAAAGGGAAGGGAAGAEDLSHGASVGEAVMPSMADPTASQAALAGTAPVAASPSAAAAAAAAAGGGGDGVGCAGVSATGAPLSLLLSPGQRLQVVLLLPPSPPHLVGPMAFSASALVSCAIAPSAAAAAVDVLGDLAGGEGGAGGGGGGGVAGTAGLALLMMMMIMRQWWLARSTWWEC